MNIEVTLPHEDWADLRDDLQAFGFLYSYDVENSTKSGLTVRLECPALFEYDVYNIIDKHLEKGEEL